MAIRTSNQIVFTEQKKVLDIIEWYLVSDKSEGVVVNKETMEADGWTTQVSSTTETQPYLWNCEEVVYSIGGSEISTPAIMRTYGKVSDIINYYTVTSTANTPIITEDLESGGWTSDFSTIQMSSVNKYLWNLEVIVYSDGTTNCSKPTIAGVYGDSAIVLKIYSLDGYEFKESVEEAEKLEKIKLQVSALKGTEQIENAKFTWSYYTPNAASGEEGDVEIDDEANGRWVDIEGYIDTTSTEFEVDINQNYALYTLRCQMTYQEYDGAEIQYFYDYVTLTKKVDVYTASIKFFSGNNVFAQGQEHIVGYVELYKNNKLVEMPSSGVTYPCTSIESGIIQTDYTFPTNTEDPAYGINRIYFTYHTEEKCQIVLGEYNEANKTWNAIEPSVQYIYVGNSDINTCENVFVVSKNSITRSKDVNFNIYTKYLENGSVDSSSLVASISTTLIDLNDTTVSDKQPENPYDGQMWFDTGSNTLMVYKLDKTGQSGSWIPSSVQQSGKTVHVLKPQSYNVGDLWIVEDDMVVESYIITQTTDVTNGEYYVFENDRYVLATSYEDNIKYYSKCTYTSGATLKAIVGSKTADGLDEFNPNHWVAVNPTLVNVQDGVSQFFKFDPKNGLRIGRINQPFYVNINDAQMGFYVNNDLKVYVGRESTSIKNLTVGESADFNCEITLDNKINVVNTNTSTNISCPGFVWQIENDGGFSLVKKEV